MSIMTEVQGYSGEDNSFRMQRCVLANVNLFFFI